MLELKEKYNKLATLVIKKNENILIESFIKYYGEKYRTLITKNIKEINYVYYYNLNDLNFLVPKFNNIFKDNDIYKDIKLLAAYLKEAGLFKNNYTKRIIGSTNEDILKNSNNLEMITNLLMLENASGGEFMDENNNKVVMLSLSLLNPLTIIHEINHSVSNIRLAFLNDKSEINKRGIAVTYKNVGYRFESIFLNELINEKSSFEIYDIFIKNGGSYKDILLPFNDQDYITAYENYFPIVNNFYNTFKNLLKESIMCESQNYLVNIIGKDNLIKYYELINLYMQKESDKENIIKEINNLVIRMEEHYKNTYDLIKNDYNKYYEDVKGTNIKKLKRR